MSRLARLGLFILGTLLVLGIGIFLIGDKQFLFSTTYHLNAEFDTVAGLPTGAEVRIGGVRKGTVENIRLPRSPSEKVVVAMDLESLTRDVVKKDSVASIETEGLLGNKFVSITFGSANAESIHDGDTIESTKPLDLSDLMKKTNDILDRTQSTMQNVEQATADMKSITSTVRGGEGTMGALIKDKTLYQRLNSTAAGMHDTVAEAKVGVTAFEENMQALKHNWFFRGFFKDRGYTDSTELTKHEIAELPPGPELNKFTYYTRDLFDKPDKAKLKNEKLLNKAGKFLEGNKFGLAVVTASTGTTGNADENRVLTQARAMVVRQYLAEKFKLDDTRLKTKGLGENGSGGEADRIEILIYPPGLKLSSSEGNKKVMGSN
jgi:outer membrane protein OmpA-like peptidoglycan-associated protein